MVTVTQLLKALKDEQVFLDHLVRSFDTENPVYLDLRNQSTAMIDILEEAINERISELSTIQNSIINRIGPNTYDIYAILS